MKLLLDENLSRRLCHHYEKDRAYHIMQTLAELDFVHYSACQGDYDDRPYFHFDEQGQTVFNQWCATCK